MKATQYCVVAVPELDNEAQIQRLREQFDHGRVQVGPHIVVVEPFTPVTLDEIQSVADHVGQARRSLHPFAVSFHQCVERGDALFFQLDQGREEIVSLRSSIIGGEPLALPFDVPAHEPMLWLARIADPRRRAHALAEANHIGRSLGIIDALHLARLDADDLRLVSRFPFGVGRVDSHERYPA